MSGGLRFGFSSDDRFKEWLKLLNIPLEQCSTAKPLFADCTLDSRIPVSKERVIKQDVLRTRADEIFFKGSTIRSLLKQSLVKYCTYHDVHYMQGINEILAPILTITPGYEAHLMEIENYGSVDGDAGPQSANVDEVLDKSVYQRFNIGLVMFEKFMAQLCPTIFSTRGLDALQAQLASFHLLLTYHDPQLAYIFRKEAMTPEVYAMPWFITLFARRLPLHIALHTWDILLQIGRPQFTIFLAVALLLSRRELILRDYSEDLPEILVALQFASTKEVNSCVQRALLLERATPISIINDIKKVVYDKSISDDAREAALRCIWVRPKGSVTIRCFTYLPIFPSFVMLSLLSHP